MDGNGSFSTFNDQMRNNIKKNNKSEKLLNLGPTKSSGRGSAWT